MIVYPGITEKSIRNVLERVALFGSHVDGFHFDFADGEYVLNTLVDLDDVGSLPKYYFEAHLMVKSPEKYFERCSKYGFKRVIVHYDALSSADDDYVLKMRDTVRDLGMQFGLAFKKGVGLPETVLCELDYVVVMTIEPGFTGQPFLPEQLDVVRKIRALCPEILLAVDGHMDLESARLAAQAGANVFISTSYLSGDNVLGKYEQLKGISNGN